MDNKLVIVTGAGGGIGKAIVKKFYENSFNIVLVEIKKEYAQNAIQALQLDANRVLPLEVNISNEDDVKGLYEDVMKRFGRVDCLINCAGVQLEQSRCEDYSFDSFKKEYETNVFGTFLMMKYALPIMQKQKSGSIVNFGSVSGMNGYPLEIGYGSSKWAIIGMSKNAANENGNNGVRINSISPGWVNTRMFTQALEDYKKAGFENPYDNITLGPMKRPAETQEIANTVYFLCSDDASYINGSNILVDGGMTLG